MDTQTSNIAASIFENSETLYSNLKRAENPDIPDCIVLTKICEDDPRFKTPEITKPSISFSDLQARADKINSFSRARIEILAKPHGMVTKNILRKDFMFFDEKVKDTILWYLIQSYVEGAGEEGLLKLLGYEKLSDEELQKVFDETFCKLKKNLTY